MSGSRGAMMVVIDVTIECGPSLVFHVFEAQFPSMEVEGRGHVIDRSI